MEWESRLIGLYVNVCAWMKQGPETMVMRMSNNGEMVLTDEEVIAIFLNGVITGRRDIKSIFNFTQNHLSSWFPALGCYENFLKRLNQLGDCFVGIVEILASRGIVSGSSFQKILDSMPIVLAKASRSNRARVANELADKGYCASKKEFYYGCKLHVLGGNQPGGLPIPEYLGTTKASVSDRKAFEQIAPSLRDCDVFCDKAYINEEKNYELSLSNGVVVITPIKLQKGQEVLDSADKMYSSAVSKIRQPIESLFNWFNEKTGIQNASKVRSSKGLMVHIYGRLAAAMIEMLKI